MEKIQECSFEDSMISKDNVSNVQSMKLNSLQMIQELENKIDQNEQQSNENLLLEQKSNENILLEQQSNENSQLEQKSNENLLLEQKSNENLETPQNKITSLEDFDPPEEQNKFQKNVAKFMQKNKFGAEESQTYQEFLDSVNKEKFVFKEDCIFDQSAQVAQINPYELESFFSQNPINLYSHDPMQNNTEWQEKKMDSNFQLLINSLQLNDIYNNLPENPKQMLMCLLESIQNYNELPQEQLDSYAQILDMDYKLVEDLNDIDQLKGCQYNNKNLFQLSQKFEQDCTTMEQFIDSCNKDVDENEHYQDKLEKYLYNQELFENLDEFQQKEIIKSQQYQLELKKEQEKERLKQIERQNEILREKERKEQEKLDKEKEKKERKKAQLEKTVSQEQIE